MNCSQNSWCINATNILGKKRLARGPQKFGSERTRGETCWLKRRRQSSPLKARRLNPPLALLILGHTTASAPLRNVQSPVLSISSQRLNLSYCASRTTGRTKLPPQTPARSLSLKWNLGQKQSGRGMTKVCLPKD